MPDFTARSDARRGEVPFDLWLNEVARLLDAEGVDPSEAENTAAAVAESLNTNFGALSRHYQFDELSPRQVVEGIEAAVSAPELPASAETPQPEASDEDQERAREAQERAEEYEDTAQYEDRVRHEDADPEPAAPDSPFQAAPDQVPSTFSPEGDRDDEPFTDYDGPGAGTPEADAHVSDSAEATEPDAEDA